MGHGWQFHFSRNFDVGHGWKFIFTRKFGRGSRMTVYFYLEVLTWAMVNSVFYSKVFTWAMVESLFLLESFDVGHGGEFLFTLKFWRAPWLTFYFYSKVLTWAMVDSVFLLTFWRGSWLIVSFWRRHLGEKSSLCFTVAAYRNLYSKVMHILFCSILAYLRSVKGGLKGNHDRVWFFDTFKIKSKKERRESETWILGIGSTLPPPHPKIISG